ncbi:hypothetical protein J6590_076961 [Homalodisca vitripennis]|nr:hypothetical protein J6590_076961 [Homalodisca vitripennis]
MSCRLTGCISAVLSLYPGQECQEVSRPLAMPRYPLNTELLCQFQLHAPCESSRETDLPFFPSTKTASTELRSHPRPSSHSQDQSSGQKAIGGLLQNSKSPGGGGVISAYKIKERKEEKKGKKRVQTYPNAASSLVQRCNCRKCKSLAQVTSTRNAITHHTGTDESKTLEIDVYLEGRV